MRKIAAVLFLLFSLVSLAPKKIQAVTFCESTSIQGVGVTVRENAGSHTIKMNLGSYEGKDYRFVVIKDGELLLWVGNDRLSPVFRAGQNKTESNESGEIKVEGNIVTWTIKNTEVLGDSARWFVNLQENGASTDEDGTCRLGFYTGATNTVNASQTSCQLMVYQKRNGVNCYFPSGCLSARGVDTFIEAKNIRDKDGKLFTGNVQFMIGASGWSGFNDPTVAATNGRALTSIRIDTVTSHGVRVRLATSPYTEFCPEFKFTPSDDPSCQNICGEETNAYESQNEDGVSEFLLCEQVRDAAAAQKCRDCFNLEKGIWTAIGCIPQNAEGIIQTLIRLALGLGGGITLLLILAGAFRLSVSQGDPKAAEEAKEQITSAVIGLLFIIFSIAMLRFIGVQVLQIPGFGT